MYLSTEHFAVSRPHRSIPSYQVETLLEQGSGELNEDVLLETGKLFGVFDGATSLDRRRFHGNLTGGLLAAQTAAEAFRENRGGLLQLADEANRRIRDALPALKAAERHLFWSTSLAVIRLGVDRMEYCQTGDAQIVLIMNDGSHQIVTPDIDIDRETLQLWQNTAVPPEAVIHNVLAEQIQKVRMQMNISYGVLNGEPTAMNFLRHGYHELSEVSDILLCTDGLFLPRENLLKENDWHTFTRLYREGGLQSIRDHVRGLQDNDPTCRRYPRFKQYDDIAAVAIRLL
jgi:serine/threonine protein phosphatase PrpC